MCARARELVLDGVGECLGRGVDRRRQRLRAPESRQVDREHVEAPLEQRQHWLPPAPGVADSVDEEERLAEPRR
jgi:hypothetical protein